MESIKIIDKLTLRQEALRMALQTVDCANISANLKNLVINRAMDIAEYIQGSADLPEFVDHESNTKKWFEMLDKLQDSIKTPCISTWISADSEMKPAKGVEVLCALRYGSKIEYLVMSYDHENKEWYGGPDDDNTNHVVAWCPIVPFTQPTL